MTAPRRRPTRPGAPSALTQDAHDALIEATADGAPREVAAAAAGISVATFYRWLQRGREVADLVDKAQANGGDYEPEDEDRPYYELLVEVERSQARAIVSAQGAMRKLSLGGYVVKTTTRRFRDPGSGQLVEETVEDIASPDVRAASFLLTRGYAKHLYTEAPKAMEMSGPDGAPIRISTDEEDLAARVAANMAQAAISAGSVGIEGHTGDEDDSEVVDGEVVT